MHIQKVTYQNEFVENDSPAKVNRRTGHLFINLSRWKHIAPQHRLFILLHEDAHCELDSSDEVAVDELAFKNFIKMGYPLTESLFALTRVLKGNGTESQSRMWAQYLRAKELDEKVNKSKFDYDGFEAIANNPQYEIISVTNSFDGEYIDVEYYEYPDIVTELEKIPTYSRKQRRKMKKSIRMYKRMGRARKKYSKADKVKAVANDIQAGADTRPIYAEKGIYVPTRAESISRGIGNGIKSIASAITGTTESESTDFPMDNPMPSPLPLTNTERVRKPNLATQKPDNLKLYIGIGAAVLAGFFLIILFKK